MDRTDDTTAAAAAGSRIYFAMIGDLVASRRLDDRAQIQGRFQDAIRTLNADLGARLAAPLKLTAGDEIQGLTQEPEVVLTVVVEVSDAVFPAEVSWGIGRGDLTTDLTDDVSLLDGPCFHRAREAIEAAKRASRWLQVRGFPDPEGTVLTGIMNLIGAIRSGWTERQAQIAREARGRKQTQVAKELDVHKSTISRALSSAHYDEVREGEEAVRALLLALAERSA